MTSLYVDRKGVSLEVDADTLVFRENGSRIGTVPLGPLERVFLRGDVTLKASALGKLGQRGVGVVILSGRKGEATLLMHQPHNDASRRLKQYQVAQDPVNRLELARIVTESKLKRQLAYIREQRELQPMSRYMLTLSAERIEKALESVDHAESVGSLRGIEGAAAQGYFMSLKELFPESLRFKGRNRRPPRDPVNAALSYTYTLLHAEAVLQVYGAGLDPFVGFLHDVSFGRESLACDVVEPLRVGADRFVQELFRRRTLEAEHFTTTKDGCLLGKAGRARFYAAWEQVADGLRNELAEDVNELRILIEAA